MKNIVKMRDPFWDVIKGIAVLLMLLGHSIEYGMGAEYFESKAYMNNQFFQFIYGFHMPLFMFLSGLVACSGVVAPYWGFGKLFRLYTQF